MKINVLSLLLVMTLSLHSFAQKPTPKYKDKSVAIEQRVEDLLKRMTLDEKNQQLNQSTYGRNTNVNNVESQLKEVKPEIGSLIYRSVNPAYRNQLQHKAMEQSRLGIPILMGFDVIHGFRTVYPIPLAQACAWNPELVTKACAVAAREAKLSGVDWTFAPMIDVARDARWGRVAEGFGEDPYTNAVFTIASVKGYQGKKLSDPFSIAACLKHYIGYSLSEGGRDYHSSDVSGQTLWETFIPPYEAGVKAGAATLMSAFNDISGVPASANFYTLTEILKKKWGHTGFVVSDWGSVDNLIAQGVAKDRKEAGQKALMAGVEMDMVDNIYVENLAQLVKENKVPMSRIDDAVRRVLRVKFQLGLFDQPFVEEVDENNRYYRPEDVAIARQLAEESMVLLKNNKETLPLGSEVKQIAVIGPLAKDKADLMGSWEGQGVANVVETLYEGLEKEFQGKATLNYAQGCDFDGEKESGFEEALAAAQKSDVVILCIGEMKKWSGENASRSTIALPAIQERLVAAVKKSGKPIILVLSNGRPLELMRLEPMADAIVEIWQPGIAGGTPLAGILSGRINPSGKLSITFPLVTGQIPTYYDMRQSARPKSGQYQDVPTEPLYWFGHGLSYTTFSYSPVKLSATNIKKSEKLVAEVEVTNTGARSGKETALWFIADPVASISRPMKELKYFEKKELKAGEKVTYRFEIDPRRDLSFPDAKGDRHLESGDFYLIINNQKVKFELVD